MGIFKLACTNVLIIMVCLHTACCVPELKVYEADLPYVGELYAVCNHGKFGFINNLGEIVIKTSYNRDELEYLGNGLVAIPKEGIYNVNGERIFDKPFTRADKLRNGILVIYTETDRYIIDTKGEVLNKVSISGSEYDVYGDFVDGIAYVDMNSSNSGATYIDYNQNIVIDYKDCLMGDDFSEGLALIITNEHGGDIAENAEFGYINTHGELVIDTNNPLLNYYDYKRYRFSEGLAVNPDWNKKYGYIDVNNNVVIKHQYDFAYPFNEGLAVVKKNNKYGVIDMKGNEIIPFKYDKIKSFSDDVAEVVIDNKYGYIDKSGAIIIAPQFDYTTYFKSGIALVRKGDTVGYINKNGNFVYILPAESNISDINDINIYYYDAHRYDVYIDK